MPLAAEETRFAGRGAVLPADLGAAEDFFFAERFFRFEGTEEKYHERLPVPNNYASTRTPFQKAM